VTAVRQRNVALILARELAVNLSTPMWIWDEQGELIYYNEHVQEILGGPAVEVGRLDELPQFAPQDLDGAPIDVDDLPSAIALRQHRPAHRDVRIVGGDGVNRTLSVTAFPLFARGGEFVGAVSVFWQVEDAEPMPRRNGAEAQ
jgi:PAS domain-containing protein